MTWEDVLQRDDIVGGDLETQEDEVRYRGPISKIELRDGMVFIESPWVARLVPGSGWEKWNPPFPFFINPTEIQPEDFGDGRIAFGISFLGTGIIFPSGGKKLHPTRVKGLHLPQ